MNFYIPGNWHFIAIAIDTDWAGNIIAYETEEVEVEVLFPDTYMIREELESDMVSLWNETLNAADEDGRQEMGFWIYADIKRGNLQITSGDTEKGARVSGCVGTNASITPSTPKITLPEEPWDDARYPIAYFHTHTTLHYCDSGERDTGFSDKDLEYSDQYSLPLFLYDYSSSEIYAGGDLNDSAEIYETDLKQRPTPESWSDLTLH